MADMRSSIFHMPGCLCWVAVQRPVAMELHVPNGHQSIALIPRAQDCAATDNPASLETSPRFPREGLCTSCTASLRKAVMRMLVVGDASGGAPADLPIQ